MSAHSTSPAAQRRHMILGQVYTNHVTDKRIIQALTDIPREPFLPEKLRGAAYVDEDLEVAPGRYLLEPMIFARLLHMAQITPDSRALVIGALTGYTAAVVSHLASKVIATESDPSFIEPARAHMQRLAIGNVTFQPVTTLADGYVMGAPYDVIIIPGAVAFIPDHIGAQLAERGRLVTVRNEATRIGAKGGLGKGMLVERIDGTLQFREHFDAGAYVMPGFEKLPTFEF